MRFQVFLSAALACYLFVPIICGGGSSSSGAGAQPKFKSGPTRNHQDQDGSYFFEPDKLVAPPLLRLAATRANTSARAKRHIRVVAIEIPPFMMLRRKVVAPAEGAQSSEQQQQRQPPPSPPGGNGDELEWYGYCMDFFRELIKHLPYEVSYEIYRVPDSKFGSKRRAQVGTTRGNNNNKTGQQQQQVAEQWSGMIGELARRRAHLALAPLAVMAERELVMDFTVPFYDLVGIQILLKRPEVPQNWFKFLTVLDMDVWLSITLAYFVTSVIIYLFDRLSPYSHKNQARIRRTHERQRRHRQKLKATAQQEGVVGGHPLRSQLGPPLPPSFIMLPAGGAAPATRPAANGGGGGRKPPLMLAYGPAAARIEPAAQASRRPSLSYLPASLRFQFGDSGGGGGGGTGGPRGARHLLDQPPASGANLSSHGHHEAHEEEEDDDDDEDASESDSNNNADGKPDFNLRDSLWFCITSLTPQGGGEAPQNLSGRVVAGAWWLFCFIVIASYTANLAAFLTVSRLDIPIESLDDLAKQYRIKYAPIDGTAEQNYFERMAYIEEIFYNIWKEMSLNDSLSEEERSKFSIWDYPISDKYTKIWSQIQEVQMPGDFEQALERVKSSTLEDGFALLANANMIKFATMTDCSLKAVGDEFSRKPIALGLAKGEEQLRDDISYAILQLINRRFMEVLREKWWTNNPARVVCETNDESEGISVENIGGVFIIILAGVLLSFLVWAIERLVYRTKLEVSRELLEMSGGGGGGLAAGQTAPNGGGSGIGGIGSRLWDATGAVK